jgi:hypothetical protein
VRTLVFHALWLLPAGYGLWLLRRPRESSGAGWRAAGAAGAAGGAGLGWWAALAGTLALALALRLHELGRRSLWLDEAISLWLARLPWADLLPTLATHDESPPLYFALLHLWRAWGENEAALRLLSVLASVSAVALGAALGTALGGRGAGLLAALCLALSPVQVHHGQEARMYALVSALTLGVTWGAVRLLERARRSPIRGTSAPYRVAGVAGSGGQPERSAVPLRGAVVWGLLLACLAATHYTAGLAGAGAGLGAFVAILLLRRRGLEGRPGGLLAGAGTGKAAGGGLCGLWAAGGRAGSEKGAGPGGGEGGLVGPGLGPLLVAGLVGAVLWLPVAPVFLAQSRLVAGHYWIPRPTLDSALTVLLDAGVGSLPLPRHVQISDPLTLGRPADVIPALLALPRLEPWRQASLLVAEAGPQVLLYVGAFLFLGLAGAGRRRGPAGVAVPLAAVAVPVLALLLVSQARPLLLARALVGSGAVVVVLLAVGAMTLPPLGRLPAVGALLAVLLLGLGQYWWYPSTEDWRTAAARLAGQARPGDLVLINGRWTQLPLDYYLARAAGGGDGGDQMVGAGGTGRGTAPAALEERGVPLDFGARGKPEPVMGEADLPRLRGRTAGRDRVWLVLSHSFDTDPQGLTRRALEAEFPCFEVWPYQGVALHLFTRC